MSAKGRGAYDVIIVGAGISGLAALWHAAASGLRAAVIECAAGVGGQIATVTHLDGLIGASSQSGIDLSLGLLDEARSRGAVFVEDTFSGIRPQRGRIEVIGETGTFSATHVVLAMGARLRQLDVTGAAAMVGRGVSQCADCDGPFFAGQDVCVIGGGDAAVQEALILSGIARTVHLVVRGELRARRSYVKRARDAANLNVVWDSIPVAVLGEQSVTGLRICNTDSGEEADLPCSGVFPFLGVEPNSGAVAGLLSCTAGGLVVTDAELRSSIPNVFAIGALRAGFGGLVQSAAGDAATAISAICRST